MVHLIVDLMADVIFGLDGARSGALDGRLNDALDNELDDGLDN